MFKQSDIMLTSFWQLKKLYFVCVYSARRLQAKSREYISQRSFLKVLGTIAVCCIAKGMAHVPKIQTLTYDVLLSKS